MAHSTTLSRLILSPSLFSASRLAGSRVSIPPEFRAACPHRSSHAHFSARSVSFGHGLLPSQELCVILPILGVYYDNTFTFSPLNLRSLV